MLSNFTLMLNNEMNEYIGGAAVFLFTNFNFQLQITAQLIRKLLRKLYKYKDWELTEYERCENVENTGHRGMCTRYVRQKFVILWLCLGIWTICHWSC